MLCGAYVHVYRLYCSYKKSGRIFGSYRGARFSISALFFLHDVALRRYSLFDKGFRTGVKRRGLQKIHKDTSALIARFSEIAHNIKPLMESGKSVETESAKKPSVSADELRADLERVLASLDDLDFHGAVEILDGRQNFGTVLKRLR